MPPAAHQLFATAFKIFIQQINPHGRVERASWVRVARDLSELLPKHLT
jgi:hypothetical protein